MKHFDEESGYTFVLEEFNDKTPDELLATQHEPIIWAIFNGLKAMDEYKLDSVPCFSANDYVFEIQKDDASEPIGICLEYFTKYEEYEACAELIDLMENLGYGEHLKTK